MTTRIPPSLNLNIRGLGVSPTLAIQDRCRALIAEGCDVCNFGLGQSPFPVPDAVVEALRAAAAEKDYLPVHGLPALREAVVGFHKLYDQIEIDPAHVLVGPGSKELMFLLQLVFYGEILICSPCWVSYLPQAQIIGRRVSRLHTRYDDGWRIRPDALRRAIEIVDDDTRPRVLVLNYPGNPTGTSYTIEELKQIADICRKYNVIVLSDEIYGRLHHTGEHVSIARFYPEGTIVSSGLSKWCGAGGWRLGTFAFPPELSWLRLALAAAASETYTSVSAPIQHAAVRAFENGDDINEYLAHSRRILAALGTHCHQTLTAAGIRIHPPTGGFYLFLDFSQLAGPLAERGIRGSADLCSRLLEDTGVAVLAGCKFVRERSELTARLAYVNFDGEAALNESRKTPLSQALPDDFLNRCCPQTVEGVKRLAAWTTGK